MSKPLKNSSLHQEIQKINFPTLCEELANTPHLVLVMCRIRDFAHHQRVLEYQITHQVFGGKPAPPGEFDHIFHISRKKILHPTLGGRNPARGTLGAENRRNAFGVKNYPDLYPCNTTGGHRVTQRDCNSTIAIANKLKPQCDGDPTTRERFCRDCEYYWALKGPVQDPNPEIVKMEFHRLPTDGGARTRTQFSET